MKHILSSLAAQATCFTLGFGLVVGGCSKKDEPPPAPASKGEAASAAPAGETTRAKPAEAAPAPSAPGADPVVLGCAEAGWERLEVKALQDGGLSVPAEGAQLPQFTFDACDDKKDCQKLALTGEQTLLAVGQNGNDVRLAVREVCGDDALVWVTDGAGKVLSGFRGHDIGIDAAVLGGDRLLVSGDARHRSADAKNGFVPREYLFTVRSSAPKKIEVARNKQRAVPVAAASQVVVVKVGAALCTTMFWKLGVDDCDFRGPSSDEWAAFGSHIVFQSGSAGKTYGTKAGERDLLPALDWIVTDGVNVAWSATGQLAMMQPKFDLATLAAEPATGPAGPKPVAIGCQRLLSVSGDDLRLRNVKLASEWRIPKSRLPDDAGDPAALACDKLYTAHGYALGLGAIGKPVPLETTETAPAASAPAVVAPVAPVAPVVPAPAADKPAPAQPVD